MLVRGIAGQRSFSLAYVLFMVLPIILGVFQDVG